MNLEYRYTIYMKFNYNHKVQLLNEMERQNSQISNLKWIQNKRKMVFYLISKSGLKTSRGEIRVFHWTFEYDSRIGATSMDFGRQNFARVALLSWTINWFEEGELSNGIGVEA